MANKLVEAAKEAVHVAMCDHELTLLRRPVSTTAPTLDRYTCSKCLAMFYVPIERHPCAPRAAR